MSSLSAHLTARTAAHGRLGFHPDCPRCTTERLTGTLGEDALVSRRTKAALAAGLLAFTAGVPATVAAASPVEGDQEQEGPGAPGGEAPGMEPEFDPGGDDGFEIDTGPVLGTPEAGGEEDSGEGAPVDAEPVEDPDARLFEEPAQPPPAAEPTPAPQAPVAPAPPPATAPPIPPAPQLPVQELVDPEARAAARDAHRRERLTATVRVQPPAQQPSYQPPASAAPAAVPADSAPAVADDAPVAQAATSTVAERTGGRGDGESYVVKPGDSLWSIATRQLGPGATSGEVARMVSRLWQLNSERIATGNPDLLNVGTELRLP
jgi:hypothetical protein